MSVKVAPFRSLFWCALIGSAVVLLLIAVHFPTVSAAGGSYPSLDPDFPGVGIANVPGLVNDVLPDVNDTYVMQSDYGVFRIFPDGEIDATFGDNGVVRLEFADGIFSPAAMVRDANNRLLVAGAIFSNAPRGGGQAAFDMVRLLSDGTVDSSFGTDGRLTVPLDDNYRGPVFALDLQDDGKMVLLAGDAFAGGRSVYRLMEDGALDASFGGDGSVHLEEVPYDMVVHPAGILTVGSYFYATEYGAVQRYRLSDGALDTTFGKNGVRFIRSDVTESKSLREVILNPDGTIWAAGMPRDEAGQGLLVTRLTADGDLDTTFSGDGIAPISLAPLGTGFDSQLLGFAVTSDALLLTGRSQYKGSIAVVVKAHLDGTVDTTFADGGYFFDYPYSFSDPQAIIATADGEYLVSGNSRLYSGLLKLSATGVPDTSYGEQGYQIYGTLSDVVGGRTVSQRDGKRLMLWYRGTMLYPTGGLVMRQQADGQFDLNYGVQGVAEVSVGGNGQGGNPVVDAAVDSTNRAIVVGFHGGLLSYPSAVVSRLNTNGLLDTTLGENGILTLGIPGREIANAVEVDADGGYIVAGRVYSDTSIEYQDFILRRILPSGDIDTTFGENGATTILDCSITYYYDPSAQTLLALDAEGGILAMVSCDRNDGTGGLFLYRFNSDGDIDTTFGTNGFVTLTTGATDIKIGVDSTITVASARFYATTQYWDVARYTATGNPDLTFGEDGKVEYAVPNLETLLSGVAFDLQPDGKTVLLGYSGEQYTWDLHLTRLLPDGNVDTVFGEGGSAQLNLVNQDMATDLDITADGAVVTGLFNQSPGVARLLLDDPTPPTPTPTATQIPTVTPTVSPTPAERMLYLPLTQR